MDTIIYLLKKFRFLLLVLYLFLLLIHFLIKDRFASIGALYYASPLPLIIILGIVLIAFFIRYKPLNYLLSIILLTISGYFFSHFFGSEFDGDITRSTSKVLFWNVAKKEPLPTNILIKHIRQSNPEIVALVEAFEVSDKDLHTLRTTCPDYDFRTLRGEMLIAVKGNIENIVFKSNVDVYRYNYMNVMTDQKNISILIADVYAYPLWNKEEALNTIHEIANKNKIDIIVGDFNTPYESIFFDNYKTDYSSFHDYSVGLTSTWPTKFPLIEIDQIWIDKSFQPIKLEKFTYNVSDHKLLIAEFRW